MRENTYHVFFSKLSNPLRISVIASLDKKAKSVNELAEELNVEQSKLSHALKELRSCNIIKFRKIGKQRIYSLSGTIQPILRLIELHGNKCCNNKCKCKCAN